MTYFDTAFIAKCYLNEPHAERVRRTAEKAIDLVSSEIARVEMFAVVHRHLRERQITDAHAEAILARFEQDQKLQVWRWLPVTSEIVSRACARVRSLPPALFVRSSDAIHLTTAYDAGVGEICTNDRHMLAAAPHFQLKGRNLVAQ